MIAHLVDNRFMQRYTISAPTRKATRSSTFTISKRFLVMSSITSFQVNAPDSCLGQHIKFNNTHVR